MAVVLHEIQRLPEPGRYALDVSVVGPHALFDDAISDDGVAGSYDEKLFLLLSERGLAERGDAGQYHADLHGLVPDAHEGKAVHLPFTFGTDRRSLRGSTYSKARWWRRLRWWRQPEA